MATTSQITEAVYRARFDDAMSAGAKQAADSVEKLGQKVEQTDEKVTRATKSAGTLANTYDPVTRAARNLTKAEQELAAAEKTLAADMAAGGEARSRAERTLATLSERVTKNREALAAARKAHEDAGSAINGIGNAAKLTTRELQQLSPQIADVGVSLAGGMNPMLILIQQGPQIVDAVGGIGRAFALVRAAITPAVAAIAAASVAIVTSTVVAESQERALASLSNRLRATRSDYASLTSQVEAASRAAAGNSSLGTGEARGAGQIIAGARNFSGTNAELQQLIQLSGRLATVLGTTVPEAAGRLAQSFDRPSEAARRMYADGLRTLDEGLLRTIERLENQGNASDAARLALDAYQRAAAQVAKSPLQAAMDELSQAFTRLWQAMRPAVEAIGGALVSVITFAIRQVTALVDGLGRVSAYLADTRVARLLFGDGAPAAEPARAQRTATDLAMDQVRGVNPRSRQRQDVQDQMQGLRAGLANATGSQRADINDALRELQGRLEGLRGPMDDYQRGLARQIDAAGQAAGAARELAQAEQEANEAARRDGQGNASAADVAVARALTQARLTAELDTYIANLQRQTRETTEATDAVLNLGHSTTDAGLALRAHNEALQYGVAGSREYVAAIDRIVLALRNERTAAVDLASAGRVAEQQRELDYLRAQGDLLGASVAERNRELAALRERQRIIAEGGNVDSAASIARISGARSLADRQTEFDRIKAGYDELEQFGTRAFDRIGQAITTSFASGGKAAVQFKNIVSAVISEIAQEIIKLSVINPLKNAIFGGNSNTISDVFARWFGGSTGYTSSGMAGVSFQAGYASTGYAMENGGIMTSEGPLPLRTYSNGGIADSPQLTLFGEGRTPEAYVPLPDGRRIPVAMEGGGSGVTVQNTNVIDARGADAGVEARIRAAMAATQQQTIAAVADIIQRGGSRAGAFRSAA